MSTIAIMNSSDRCYCQDNQHLLQRAIQQAFWKVHTMSLILQQLKMGLGFCTGLVGALFVIILPVAMSMEDKIRRQLEIQNKTAANIVIPAIAITINTS